MSGEFIAFLVLGLIALAGGVLLLNLKQVVHMVLAMVATFLSIAGIYILLTAEFLGVVQILIYSGAITIMMLFGIMLTQHRDVENRKLPWARKAPALLGVIAFGAAVYYGIYNLEFPQVDAELYVNNVEQIGMAIYTKYIIPFELTSIVLLVALVGAIILAKRDNEKEADPE
jgi:NADH-quinone oxidoreductase subunit J